MIAQLEELHRRCMQVAGRGLHCTFDARGRLEEIGATEVACEDEVPADEADDVVRLAVMDVEADVLRGVAGRVDDVDGDIADAEGVAAPHQLHGQGGIPTVPAFGPGLLPLAHGPNEYVDVESVIEASKIYALPTALVGSIGVIYLRPVLEQILSKVGIDFSVYKSGEFKDMTGFWRSPTERESEKFQALINEIFDNFVAVVASGRSLDDTVVRTLATGEVMTAQRGKSVGLVDEIGDFKDALEAVAEVARCKPIPRWIRPSRSLGQRLLGRTTIGQQTAGRTLVAGLERVMAGGIYYLEPGHIAGGGLGYNE
mgnify:CR=1 FL=1